MSDTFIRAVIVHKLYYHTRINTILKTYVYRTLYRTIYSQRQHIIYINYVSTNCLPGTKFGVQIEDIMIFNPYRTHYFIIHKIQKNIPKISIQLCFLHVYHILFLHIFFKLFIKHNLL